MIRTLKMIRFRLLFAGLFLLLNKVCLANTAQFKITPYYESYYGFKTEYAVYEADKIFYLQNGGMRVLCNATGIDFKVLKVYWFEKIGDRYEKVSGDRSAGIWDPGNKTLIISREASDMSLEGREFACKTMESGLYDQYSTAQVFALAYLNEFNIPEKELVRTEGQAVFITCPKPAGAPEPVISWTHNGTLIDIDSDPNLDMISSNALQVKQLSLSDSGSYWCTAGNVAGEVQSPLTTIVVNRLNNKLSFTQTPRNITAKSGTSVTLNCRFNRKPDYYGWSFKAGVASAPQVRESVRYSTGKWQRLDSGDLIINSLDRNDSGKYTCYGRDDDNNINVKAYVIVNYFDVSEAVGPEDGTGLIGSSYTVRCKAPPSYPPAQLTMYKNEIAIAGSSDGYTLSHEDNQYSYVIENVKEKDAGTYKCSAVNRGMVNGSNPWSPWVSRQATVNVREKGLKPEQFEQKRSYSVNEGDSVTLSCSALADPHPTVQWYKTSGDTWSEVNTTRATYSEIPSDSGEKRYNFSLTIEDTTVEDHDFKYYCKLTNKLGSSDSPKISLYINHMTCRENRRIQEKRFNVQEPAHIACPQALSSHPHEAISWIYNTSSSSLQRNGNSLYTDTLTAEDEGSYVCVAKNNAGNCTYTINIVTRDPSAVIEGSNKALVFVVAAIVFIGLLFVAFLLFLQIKKRAKKKRLESTEALERLNQPVFHTSANGYEDGPSHALLHSPAANMTQNQLYSTLSKFSNWQIARSRLRNFSLLGEGQFGSVYQAELRSLDGSPSTYVAIKQIKDDNNPEAILEYEKEMLMMTQLHHPNIVRLIGLCTDMPPYYILTEFMEKGNLASFLQEIAQSKTENRLTLPEQIRISLQIASGLRYMADKEFVHRDVAARNCLVGRDLLVKVADFGLSRSVRGREIYQKDGGTVPIRWMSPEAIQYGQYTTANDVWAFGVTVWEVFSYGVIPYSAWSNEDVALNVQQGSRLIRPDGCPTTIYNIMSHCWAEQPERRPVFAEIIESLNAL